MLRLLTIDCRLAWFSCRLSRSFQRVPKAWRPLENHQAITHLLTSITRPRLKHQCFLSFPRNPFPTSTRSRQHHCFLLSPRSPPIQHFLPAATDEGLPKKLTTSVDMASQSEEGLGQSECVHCISDAVRTPEAPQSPEAHQVPSPLLVNGTQDLRVSFVVAAPSCFLGAETDIPWHL